MVNFYWYSPTKQADLCSLFFQLSEHLDGEICVILLVVEKKSLVDPGLKVVFSPYMTLTLILFSRFICKFSLSYTRIAGKYAKLNMNKVVVSGWDFHFFLFLCPGLQRLLKKDFPCAAGQESFSIFSF